MFSKIFHSLTAFFNTLTDPGSSLLLDHQIQTELEQAARRDMVSTRSQDNTPASGASKIVGLEKKRKTGGEGEDTPAQPTPKRRRDSVKFNADAAGSSSTRKRDRPRKGGPAKTVNGGAGHETNFQSSDRETHSYTDSSPLREIVTDQDIEDKENKAAEVAVDKPGHQQDIISEVFDVDDQVKPGTENPTRSTKARSKRKIREDSEDTANVDRNVNVNTIRKKPGTSFTTVAETTHKRFGSEEIGIPETIPSTGIEERKGSWEDLSEDKDGSEDDAPETVTASAGFDKARTSALEVAKAAARYHIRNPSSHVVGVR